MRDSDKGVGGGDKETGWACATLRLKASLCWGQTRHLGAGWRLMEGSASPQA